MAARKQRPAAVRLRAQATFHSEAAGLSWAQMPTAVRELVKEPGWQGPALADCERIGEILELTAEALRREAAGRLWPRRLPHPPPRAGPPAER